ncbi:MAG: hypothetical protein AB7N54_12665 [Alphaproteobacteria bacterium]
MTMQQSPATTLSMFGISLTKLAVLVAIVALVWLVLRRFDGSRKARRSADRLGRGARFARDSGVRDSRDDAIDTEYDVASGAYVPRKNKDGRPHR